MTDFLRRLALAFFLIVGLYGAVAEIAESGAYQPTEQQQ